MKREVFALVLILLLTMLALPRESIGQTEFYLDFLVSSRLTLYAVNDEVLDGEVLGRRTWWVHLRNQELSIIPWVELEIRTLRKPDSILFYPSPQVIIPDEEYFVLKWRFEQIPRGEERGLWLSFNEDEVFRLGANITRIAEPSIFANVRGRLTCLTKIVSSSRLDALWVSMRIWETDEVTSRILRTEPTPSRERDNERGWTTPNVANSIPYFFKMELDLVNKVFPSSLMYRPWVQVMQIHRHRTLGRAYSYVDPTVLDDVLGTVRWRVGGMHYWVWRHEEARDTIFEAISTSPAGEPSAQNMLRADRSRACFWRESVLGHSQATVGCVADQSSQTGDLTPLRSIGREGFSVPRGCLCCSSPTIPGRRLSSVFVDKLSLPLAKS